MGDGGLTGLASPCDGSSGVHDSIPETGSPEIESTKKNPATHKNGREKRDLGDDLLSHRLGSTIGAAGLNFSVRNGKRWTPCAIATEIKMVAM